MDGNDDNSTFSDEIESWKRIIAELSQKAPTDTIKECIQKYDPAIPTNENKKLLKVFCKGVILDTLHFLSCKPVKDSIKSNLIEMLCLKIKNYFPDVCQICSNSYCFKFGDTEFLSCRSCGQEAHQQCYLDLLKDMNLINENEQIQKYFLEIPGFFFLCPSCQDEIILLKDDTKPNITTSDRRDNIISESLTETNYSQISSDPLNSNDHAVHLSQYGAANNSTANLSDNQDKQYEGIDNLNLNKAKICKFYAKGSCKHGRKGSNCKFQHPEVCRKLLKFGNKSQKGCNKGTKCSKFHPRMCSSSIINKVCFNHRCTYTHVKGTKRNKDHLNSLNNNKDQKNDNITQVSNQGINDFLPLLHNFKRDIEIMMDTKLEKFMIKQTQPILSQPINPAMPRQTVPIFQPPVWPLPQPTVLNQQRNC